MEAVTETPTTETTTTTDSSPTPADQLQQYYTYLKQKGADVPPTYQSFQTTLQDPKQSEQYYNYLKTNKFDVAPTYESFANTFGLKKNATSQNPSPTSTPAAQPTAQPSVSGGQPVSTPSLSGNQSDPFGVFAALQAKSKPTPEQIKQQVQQDAQQQNYNPTSSGKYQLTNAGSSQSLGDVVPFEDQQQQTESIKNANANIGQFSTVADKQLPIPNKEAIKQQVISGQIPSANPANTIDQTYNQQSAALAQTLSGDALNYYQHTDPSEAAYLANKVKTGTATQGEQYQLENQGLSIAFDKLNKQVAELKPTVDTKLDDLKEMQANYNLDEEAKTLDKSNKKQVDDYNAKVNDINNLTQQIKADPQIQQYNNALSSLNNLNEYAKNLPDKYPQVQRQLIQQRDANLEWQEAKKNGDVITGFNDLVTKPLLNGLSNTANSLAKSLVVMNKNLGGITPEMADMQLKDISDSEQKGEYTLPEHATIVGNALPVLAQSLPMLATFAGTEGGASALGATEGVGTAGTAFGLNYGSAYQQAKQSGLSNGQSEMYALNSSALQALLFKALPQTGQVGKLLKGGDIDAINKTTTDAIADKLANGETFNNALQAELKNYGTGALNLFKNAAGGSAVLTGINAGTQLAQAAANTSSGQQAFQTDVNPSQMMKEFITNTIAFAPLGIGEFNNETKNNSQLYKYAQLDVGSNPQDYLDALFKKQQKGEITNEQFSNATTFVDKSAELVKQMPQDLAADAKIKILPLLAERNKLEKDNTNLGKPFVDKNKERINAIDQEIGDIADESGHEGKAFNTKPESLLLPKTQTNALQKPSTGEILQRQPQETGETGSERTGVESSQQGQKTTQQGEDKAKALADHIENIKALGGDTSDLEKQLGELQKQNEVIKPVNQIVTHPETHDSERGLVNTNDNVNPDRPNDKLDETGIENAKKVDLSEFDHVETSENERVMDAVKYAKLKEGVTPTTNPLLNTLDVPKQMEGEPESKVDYRQLIESNKGKEFQQQQEKLWDYKKEHPDTAFYTHSSVEAAQKALDETGGKWTDETTNKFVAEKGKQSGEPQENPKTLVDNNGEFTDEAKKKADSWILNATPKEISDRADSVIGRRERGLKKYLSNEDYNKVKELEKKANSDDTSFKDSQKLYKQIDEMTKNIPSHELDIQPEEYYDEKEWKRIKQVSDYTNPEILKDAENEQLFNMVGREITDPRTTDTKNNSPENILAFREAYNELKRRGLDDKEIIRQSLSEREQRGNNAEHLFQLAKDNIGKITKKTKQTPEESSEELGHLKELVNESAKNESAGREAINQPDSQIKEKGEGVQDKKEQAKQDLNDALADIKKLTKEGNNLSIAKLPENEAERLYKLHQAYFKAATSALKLGKISFEEFYDDLKKRIGDKIEPMKQIIEHAFDVASGKADNFKDSKEFKENFDKATNEDLTRHEKENAPGKNEEKQGSENKKSEKEEIKPGMEKVGAGDKKTAGIAQRIRQQRADVLGLQPADIGVGWTQEEALERGKNLINQGVDPHDIIDDFNKDGKISDDTIAVVQAHAHALARLTNEAGDKFGLDSPEYKKAVAEEDKFLKEAKPMQTVWSRAGVAQHGDTDIDTGSPTGLARAFKEQKGSELTKPEQDNAKKLADDFSKLKKERDDLEDKLTDLLNKEVDKTKPDLSKKEIAKQKLDDARRDFRKAAGLSSGGLEALPEFVKLVKAYAEYGFESAKEAFEQFRKDFPKAAILQQDFAKHFDKQVKELNDNSAEAKNIRRLEKELEDLQQGIVKDKADKRPLSEREKELQEQIADVKKDLGLSPSSKKVDKEIDKDKQLVDLQKAEKKKFTDLVKSFADKTDNKFTPDEAKNIWEYAKKEYIEKGADFGKMISNTALDLGLRPDQVRDALTTPKGSKEITNEMYKKQNQMNMVKQHAEQWVKSANNPKAAKFLKAVPRFFFALKTFGHGTVGFLTHAGVNLFDPLEWKRYFPNFLNQFKYAYGDTGKYEQAMEDLKNDPDFYFWKRAGLAVDPTERYDDYQFATNIFNKMGTVGKWLTAGDRGFNALKVYRLDRAKALYEGLSNVEKADPDTAKEIAKLVNHSTGTSKIPLPESANIAFFAPRLEVSRWNKLISDPAKAIKTLTNWKNADASDKVAAKIVASRAGRILATYAGALVVNQALLSLSGSNQSINFTNPTKSDWLKFKADGYTIDLTGGMVSTLDFLTNMAHIATESKKEVRTNRTDQLKSSTWNYVTGKFSPFASTVKDFATHHDFAGNTLPNIPFIQNNQDKPYHEWNKQLTWKEYLEQQQTPIPVSEAFNNVERQMQAEGVKESTAKQWLAGTFIASLVGFTGMKIGEEPVQQPVFNKEESKDPAVKYFMDKGFEMPYTALSSEKVKDRKTSTIKSISDYPKPIQDAYLSVHKENLKKELNKVVTTGYVYANQYGEVSLKIPQTIPKGEKFSKTPLNKLTDDQTVQILHKAQVQATEFTKKKMFGQ